MTTYTWPTPAPGNAFWQSQISLGFVQNQMVTVSLLSGAHQTVTLPGARLRAQVTFPPQSYALRADLEAFLTRISGMEHRIAMWDHSRPNPRGTIAGGAPWTGVTAGAAAQFATTLVLSGAVGTNTIKAGDWLRLTLTNGLFQLLQTTQDFTASSGVITMTDGIRPALRSACSAGAAVLLDKPTALFVINERDGLMIPKGPGGVCPEFTIELVELFS